MTATHKEFGEDIRIYDNLGTVPTCFLFLLKSCLQFSFDSISATAYLQHTVQNERKVKKF
jgi:hypothetical protein